MARPLLITIANEEASMRVISIIGVAIATAAVSACGSSSEETAQSTSALESGRNRAGVAASFTPSGTIDTSNPFFQQLGTNGRSCATCHDARGGWTMTPQLANQIFDATGGLDPLFSTVDETNSPNDDISTIDARRSAFSMLLARATTRFLRTVPATAEFTVTAVDDPYGFSTPAKFSNFRRPIPVSNVAKEVSITWTGSDGDMKTKLMGVMNGGSKFHAQRPNDVPLAEQAAGADFMLSLSFAQSVDKQAGPLDADGALGGPANLAKEPFYIGINSLTGDSKTGAAFDNESFEVFAAWEDLEGSEQNRARAKIARGEEAFYTLPIRITGVPGLNDALGQPVIDGHCTTCHNTPNVAGHSVFRMLNVGVADASRRTSDVPLLTVRNKATGEEIQTTDLGRALSTGKWADIGKFKVPTLRGAGARPPYFHDGSAPTLHQVLDFYKHRFGVDFKGAEDDIVAFLQAI